MSPPSKPVARKAELYYDYGTKYLVDKDYTKALTNLRKAHELDPTNSKIHNNLGMAYFFKKDMTSALSHLKKSVELDTKNSDARNNLASIYFYQKKYKQAYNEYEVILKDLEYTQQFRTSYNLALIDFKFGRNTIGLQRLKKAVKENPDYCAAHYQLGSYSHKINDYGQALTHFSNATKGVCMNNPAPYYQQAKMLLKLGKHDKALYSLTELINRFPKSKYTILAKRKLHSININKLEARSNNTNIDKL
jgi:Tfp pilus assembly protein PilF